MIYIGDYVCKPSRKSFENGKRVAKVIGYTLMDIPDQPNLVDAVELEGCLSPVASMTVHTDSAELRLLIIRDTYGWNGENQPRQFKRKK